MTPRPPCRRSRRLAGYGLTTSATRNSRKPDERAAPSDGIHEQRDEHAHHFVDDDLPGIGAAEVPFARRCRSTTPPTKIATIATACTTGRRREQPPERAGRRPIRTCPERTGRSRRRAPWTGARPGFGIRDSGLRDWRDSRPSCSSADDARAGEAIVEAAMVAAEQRGDETEAGRHGEQRPTSASAETRGRGRATVRVGRHDADAGGHLAERLPAGRERDEVAAVLDEQEREQRPFRQDAEIVERRARRSAS